MKRAKWELVHALTGPRANHVCYELRRWNKRGSSCVVYASYMQCNDGRYQVIDVETGEPVRLYAKTEQKARVLALEDTCIRAQKTVAGATVYAADTADLLNRERDANT